MATKFVSGVATPALPPMRRWQGEAIQATNNILIEQEREHIYVCAPTASGKSRFIYELSELLPIDGVRIIIVGLDQISNQLREDFKNEYGCKTKQEHGQTWFISTTGRQIYIGTYQGLAALATQLFNNEQLPQWKTGVLFFDEIHVGGSNSKGRTGEEEFFDQSSAQRIFTIFEPKKKVYVSATTQTADPRILGQKLDHFYRYTMSDAFKDGILNAVDMVEVHAGITLKIKKTEEFFGRTIEELETLSASDLEGLASRVKTKSVSLHNTDPDTVRWLIQSRHREMIRLYAAKHFGEQAIFYCPKIEDAERAAQDFNYYMNSMSLAKARRTHGKAPRAMAYHSSIDMANTKLDAFVKGSIEVLFVVGMLQEGFNMPSLALAFDCRFHRIWNAPKIARLVQKVGRLMRILPGKGRSRYYYARDISDFINNNAPLDPEITELDDQDLFEPEEIINEAEINSAAIAVAKIVAVANGAKEFDSAPAYDGKPIEVGISESDIINVFNDGFQDDPEIKIANITQRPIKIIITPMFVAVNAYGHVERRSYDFCSIVSEKSPDHKKAQLLGLPTGTPRPSQHNHPLGVNLSSYTNSGLSFDPIFNAKIRDRFPEWFISSSDLKKAELLALPSGTFRPSQNSGPLGKALCEYTAPNGRMYDAVFTAEINKVHPTWLINTADLKKAEILKLSLDSERPTGKLGGCLSNYLKVNGSTYDADFDREVRSRFPHWFVNKNAENKKALLALPIGSPRPANRRGPGELGGVLGDYTCKTASGYDPEFATAIREKQPLWFANTAQLKKDYLLTLPLDALRPDRTLSVGRMLQKYMSSSDSVYDPTFTEQIKARFPHWFRDPESVDKKKAEMLNMPLGTPKLKPGTLMNCLGSYTRPNSDYYDVEFDSKIRTRFPHWFITKDDGVREKKDTLLSLPSGTARPKSDGVNNKLASALYFYTWPNSKVYDPEFTTAIRKAQPHWFKQ